MGREEEQRHTKTQAEGRSHTHVAKGIHTIQPLQAAASMSPSPKKKPAHPNCLIELQAEGSVSIYRVGRLWLLPEHSTSLSWGRYIEGEGAQHAQNLEEAPSMSPNQKCSCPPESRQGSWKEAEAGCRQAQWWWWVGRREEGMQGKKARKAQKGKAKKVMSSKKCYKSVSRETRFQSPKNLKVQNKSISKKW